MGVFTARCPLPHVLARRRLLGPAAYCRGDWLAAKTDDTGGHECRDRWLGWRDSAEQGRITDLFSRNMAGPQCSRLPGARLDSRTRSRSLPDPSGNLTPRVAGRAG